MLLASMVLPLLYYLAGIYTEKAKSNWGCEVSHKIGSWSQFSGEGQAQAPGHKTTKGMSAMEDFRCQCKKIICQIEGDTIIIKCRHCKRYIHVNTKGITNIEFRLTADRSETGPAVVNLSRQEHLNQA